MNATPKSKSERPNIQLHQDVLPQQTLSPKAEYPYLYNKPKSSDSSSFGIITMEEADISSLSLGVNRTKKHQNDNRNMTVGRDRNTTRSPSPSSRISFNKDHPASSFRAAEAYMEKPFSISSPSSTIRSSRSPGRAGPPSNQSVNPLEQFKLAATMRAGNHPNQPTAAKLNHKRRAASESPLRQTRTVQHVGATVKRDQVHTSRSSSVPRRHYNGDAEPSYQPPTVNRFSSLVSERRQQFDQLARGRSPGPHGPRTPLDSAKDFYQKVGMVGPHHRSTSPSKGHPTPTQHMNMTAKQDPRSRFQKKDPEVITFKKKGTEPIQRSSTKEQNRQLREPESDQQHATRNETSPNPEVLSEKRPTKNQTEASTLSASKGTTSAPRSVSAERKRVASGGLRSYGFAERLSNQLARSDADRKQSVGSNATSVATPVNPTHPVFGYPKHIGNRTAVVAQSSARLAEVRKQRVVTESNGIAPNETSHYDSKREDEEYSTTYNERHFPSDLQSSNSIDDQLQVDDDDETDPSDESELSCVRRSKHLHRIMRPHSSSLVHSGPTSKRKIDASADGFRRRNQTQLHSDYDYRERVVAPTKRVKSASPYDRRAHNEVGQLDHVATPTRRNHKTNGMKRGEKPYDYRVDSMASRRSVSAEKKRGLPVSVAIAHSDLHYEDVSDQDSLQPSRPRMYDGGHKYHNVSASSRSYNTASQLHHELDRRQPSYTSNREPGGTYGADDVSSFMRVPEPPGALDPPDPRTEKSTLEARNHRSAASEEKRSHYESFRSLEERRRDSRDAPSGRSFLGTQSSTDASSQQPSVVDNSESSKEESALQERTQNQQALEDLLHEKAKRMGRRQSEAMDESSDSRADAFMWLHQKYGSKAPTMNRKAIEKAKAKAMGAKGDANQKKTEVTATPIFEDEEDIFSGLDDMSSFSKKASPAPSPRNDMHVSRSTKAPKITVESRKARRTPKDEKNSVKSFQEAFFSNTIISDLTTSLTERHKIYARPSSKNPTVFSEIEETPSNDDSSDASQQGCKRTTSVVAGLGQTIGKSIVSSLQNASCNVPDKISMPQCDKARCEHRINEALRTANDDKDYEDNITVTETILNEVEKRIWAAWDRRRSRPLDETPVVSTSTRKVATVANNLKVDTASTCSSENRDEALHERDEAKAELANIAHKAVDMYGTQYPHTASLAKLHSIDSSTHRPKPVVSVAAGTPVSKLSTTMTFEDQAMLEEFSSALKNTGVEVLKLGRKNKWQVRYLTVSKEVTKLSNGGVAGDIGQCPMALLWPKSFKGHNFSVSTIKENGRGGVLFKHLKKVRPTASNEYYDHHLPKKLKQMFPEFAGVVLDYLHDGGARQLHLCFKSNAEAQAFITAMLIIREATERTEGDDSLLDDPAECSSATNSKMESEQ